MRCFDEDCFLDGQQSFKKEFFRNQCACKGKRVTIKFANRNSVDTKSGEWITTMYYKDIVCKRCNEFLEYIYMGEDTKYDDSLDRDFYEPPSEKQLKEFAALEEKERLERERTSGDEILGQINGEDIIR